MNNTDSIINGHSGKNHKTKMMEINLTPEEIKKIKETFSKPWTIPNTNNIFCGKEFADALEKLLGGTDYK